MHKKCNKCNKEKLFSEFDKNKSQKDGYQSQCKICVKTYQKIYREAHKDKSRKYALEYYDVNRIKLKALSKEHYELNKENTKVQKQEYNRKWRLKNLARLAAKSSKRRALKLRATPKWLTEEHYAQIEGFYRQSRELKLLTGEEYHVDHIVPLQGENVCGLHVPWNLQVITAKENLSKYNKFLQD